MKAISILFSVTFLFASIASTTCSPIHDSAKPVASSHDYIESLSLEKHIEGGYFIEKYRSDDNVQVLSPRYDGNLRSAGTSIYFLLESDDFSSWHRIKSDEMWHYYDGGSPIDIYIISKNGELTRKVLGNPALDENASFQVLVKGGEWFAAEVRDKNSFGLVGCTVCPGFEYKDFEIANRDSLIQLFPVHKEMIKKFTRS